MRLNDRSLNSGGGKKKKLRGDLKKNAGMLAFLRSHFCCYSGVRFQFL